MHIRRMLMTTLLLAISANGASSSLAAQSTTQISFSVIDIGSLEHPDQTQCADQAPGAAINAIAPGNRAVGRAYVDDTRSVAALYSADGIRTMESGKGGGSAEAINRNGDIAGTVFSTLPDEPCGEPSDPRPAHWNADFELDRLPLPEGIDAGAALGINDRGSIVGWVLTEAGRQAAIWSAEGIRVLPIAQLSESETLTSEAVDINDAGVVTGTMTWTDASGKSRSQPFIWDGEAVSYLNPAPAPNAVATSINASGVVAGALVEANGNQQPVLWSGGTIVGLDTLPDRSNSAVTDINSGGIAVGFGARSDGLSRAALWIDGGVVDLNDVIPQELGWQLQYAAGINDDGTIAAWGDLDGVRRAVLLVPAAG